ncbi:hypothetical protein V6R21_29530 [Limibacter armeniacum]|uniref:hypothetical protein n=1 Tax=Limibacter armeniacum TaxID=466084 RepID=UPI002FE5B93C
MSNLKNINRNKLRINTRHKYEQDLAKRKMELQQLEDMIADYDSHLNNNTYALQEKRRLLNKKLKLERIIMEITQIKDNLSEGDSKAV